MAGLCRLLNGRQIVALMADQANIRTASGNILTYHRKIEQAGSKRALAWDLHA
jgi:hypothetical protein